MDQIKIGQFIAQSRKEKNLTQALLAEKLGITDKAVSKWERGIAMPDAALMLSLCNLLGITVNELLMGEKNTMENNEKNERLLLDLASEIAKKEKTIFRSTWVILAVSFSSLLAGLAAVAFLMEKGPLQAIVAISLTVLFLIPCFYALKLEISVGAYKCTSCEHEFTPSFPAALCAMHMGTTRYLKCPKCKKRSWCKKILKK